VLCFAPDSAEWALAPAVVALVWGLTQAGPLGRAVFANRLAVYWGERSYSIYMVHAVVQILCDFVLIHFGRTELSWAKAWVLFCGEAGLALLVANYSYAWFEVPMRQRVRAFLDRSQSMAPTSGLMPAGEGAP